MGRPLDVDIVVAKHSSLTGQSVDVELPGLLERTHVAQTGPEKIRRAQSVGTVIAEHTPIPGSVKAAGSRCLDLMR